MYANVIIETLGYEDKEIYVANWLHILLVLLFYSNMFSAAKRALSRRSQGLSISTARTPTAEAFCGIIFAHS